MKDSGPSPLSLDHSGVKSCAASTTVYCLSHHKAKPNGVTQLWTEAFKAVKEHSFSLFASHLSQAGEEEDWFLFW